MPYGYSADLARPDSIQTPGHGRPDVLASGPPAVAGHPAGGPRQCMGCPRRCDNREWMHVDGARKPQVGQPPEIFDSIRRLHADPQTARAAATGGKRQSRSIRDPQGQVGYHHSLTWHGSPTNRSDRKRRAIAVHYMPGHTVYAPTGNHPMEKHICVKPGEAMSGDTFPVVYQKLVQQI